MKLLIIDDDKILAESLQSFLKSNGFDADAVYDGDDGAAYGKTGVYDLIILDVKIPKLNGYQVARYLRMYMITTPILMLSAKREISDRIEGLNAGADYYLTKPFDNQELLAVIKALLRRQGNQMYVLQYGNTMLDLTGYSLNTKTITIPLSKKEFNVMRILMQLQGRSISKDDLINRIWGYNSDAEDNNVEVYITRLRKKLKAIESDLIIKNIRMLGYHLKINDTL